MGKATKHQFLFSAAHDYSNFMLNKLSLDTRERDGQTGKLIDQTTDRQWQPQNVTLTAHTHKVYNHRSFKGANLFLKPNQTLWRTILLFATNF